MTDRQNLPQIEVSSLLPFADLALGHLHREYPYASIQVLLSEGDLALPRNATPAFCGSFDWHSSVHSHWALVRILRFGPPGEVANRIREALAIRLTPENIDGELAFARRRPGFERPYGLAWLSTLRVELEAAGSGDGADRDCAAWAERIGPLTDLAETRVVEWLEKLPFPIRAGEHSQTAFSLGLLYDAAAARGDRGLVDTLARHVLEFHRDDRDAPVRYEPSGHDFLSPTLAVADVMRRALPTSEFSEWVRSYWPDESAIDTYVPVEPPDRSDGKLAHLDGLNLSRAWMLAGVSHALPEGDSRRERLDRAASAHARAGLPAADGEFYEGGHWLGSFAVYLLTEMGAVGRGPCGGVEPS
ncbi:MAG: DUF2891 domain-containing protein [Planctomycetota bacterium]